ncbi:MAG: phospholipase [Actinomycetota bacterium]|nr:phospholipase [Actinomycetota bacterium]
MAFRGREPASDPQGLLVLHHGRGPDENDLFPLLDALDPERRLLGVTPRGPLHLPPGGAHWYVVPRVGYPDPATFQATYATLSAWHDALAVQTGIPPERTVLGGFSQGSVMSYALGLGPDRPRPAGILALSGFIPTVPGWAPDLERPLPRVAIGHGAVDPVIPVEFAREARECLESAGGDQPADILYREYSLPHTIDPAFLQDELVTWLRETVSD